MKEYILLAFVTVLFVIFFSGGLFWITRALEVVK